MQLAGATKTMEAVIVCKVNLKYSPSFCALHQNRRDKILESYNLRFVYKLLIKVNKLANLSLMSCCCNAAVQGYHRCSAKS